MPSLGIDPDRVEEFHELKDREDYDPLDYWYKEINPFIVGMERPRKATLITLASGDMGTTPRSRVSTLLVGPPGTGKSEIRDFVAYELDHIGEQPCIGVGPRSTAVGLKYDARGQGTPGALAQADQGVIAIEELDKFSKSERDALYESMGKGRYEVVAGGERKTLDARVRVIAAANSTDPLDDPLLDRFDFIIRIGERPLEEIIRIMHHTYENFFSGRGENTERLRDYLKWCRVSKPIVDKEDEERIEEIGEKFLRSVAENDGEIPKSSREQQSYYRIALVIARLNREKLKPKHYMQALRLKEPNRKEILDEIEKEFF